MNGEQEQQPEEAKEPENRGQIIVTFNNDDTMSVAYTEMKPWKFWAAGKMVESLGDQMLFQNQMAQMQEAQQRQAFAESLMRAPGGLRGRQS